MRRYGSRFQRMLLLVAISPSVLMAQTETSECIGMNHSNRHEQLKCSAIVRNDDTPNRPVCIRNAVVAENESDLGPPAKMCQGREPGLESGRPTIIWRFEGRRSGECHGTRKVGSPLLGPRTRGRDCLTAPDRSIRKIWRTKALPISSPTFFKNFLRDKAFIAPIAVKPIDELL